MQEKLESRDAGWSGYVLYESEAAATKLGKQLAPARKGNQRFYFILL
ncbi:hypothetical protein [Lysinibacillus sphaericus]|nr:hypothetical protein [Lysinibacillus sphaericus]MEB7452715.1 hypothetical protein [Lysinibacillus sphaericus]QPA60141.1 hypothetical protein INQ55_07265 [Lysinibacillus sphaericus]